MYPSQLVVHDTLVKAHAIMGERGHCKDLLMDDNGRVCIRGALNLAAVGDAKTLEWRVRDTPLNLLLDACERAMGFCGINAAGDDAAFWNNDANTTDEMILARLRLGIQNTMPAPPPRRLQPHLRTRLRVRGTPSRPAISRGTFSPRPTPEEREKTPTGVG